MKKQWIKRDGRNKTTKKQNHKIPGNGPKWPGRSLIIIITTTIIFCFFPSFNSFGAVITPSVNSLTFSFNSGYIYLANPTVFSLDATVTSSCVNSLDKSRIETRNAISLDQFNFYVSLSVGFLVIFVPGHEQVSSVQFLSSSVQVYPGHLCFLFFLDLIRLDQVTTVAISHSVTSLVFISLTSSFGFFLGVLLAILFVIGEIYLVGTHKQLR